ncbi:alpha/beta fold hydrolase [Streptomyces clavifer]|uniref:alpha/beta fold hydrolase n=1 Tax=Streptomyces clavifer TaxID=68188 RepID=UPI003652042A
MAARRRVITYDNRGVGASGGSTPDTIEAMARDTVPLIRALGFDQVDLLGLSMGGFMAQVIEAEEPDLVRRVILAGTAPRRRTRDIAPGDTGPQDVHDAREGPLGREHAVGLGGGGGAVRERAVEAALSAPTGQERRRDPHVPRLDAPAARTRRGHPPAAPGVPGCHR